MANDSTSADLRALFDAERSIRRIHAELVKGAGRGGGPELDRLVAALASETAAARALKDPAEQALRLVRIAELLGDLHGDRVVDLLIDILGGDEPEARVTAGEALEGIAFDRFKEVALGVERALGRLPAGSPALSELPYLLAEVPEPGAAKLLGRFLRHTDPEAVAAGIEALVEMADPSAVSLLAPLEKDTRAVHLEDDEGEEGSVTIGELAKEARELLAELAGPRRAETPSQPPHDGRRGRPRS